MKKKTWTFIVILCVSLSIFIFRLKTESSPAMSIPLADSSEDESIIPSETEYKPDVNEEIEEEIKEDLLAGTTYIDQEGNLMVKNTDDIFSIGE